MSGRLPLPPGTGAVYSFNVLNTLSWTIIQNIPFQLFLKSQGAPAWVVGTGMALVPLMQVLQFAGAARAGRVGYKRLVIEGWTARTFVILGIVLAAFASPWLGPVATLAVILPIMAVYTALRGYSSAGFSPWWSRLAPEAVRGRFLALESMVMNLALIASLLGCSLFLAHWNSAAAFATLFLWAFAAGLGGMFFLRRIPEVAIEPDPGNGAVPWRELLGHRPFIRFLVFSALFNIALAGAGICWVTLLRDRFQASDAMITLMPALAAGANVAVLPWVARILDRVGSRPVMATGVGLMALTLLLWWALAAGLLPYRLATLIAIQLVAGTAWALVNVASTRLLMGTIPGQGRAHFFAMHGVCAALALGLLPTLWGGGIDLMHHLDRALGPIGINAWSVLYPLLAVIALASLIPLAAVHEPRALSTRDFLHELLVRTPARALARLVGWPG